MGAPRTATVLARGPIALLALLAVASACGDASRPATTRAASAAGRTAPAKRAVQTVNGRPTEGAGEADHGPGGAAEQALDNMAWPRERLTLADVLGSRQAQAALVRHTRGLLAARRWRELGPRVTVGSEATGTIGVDIAAEPRAYAVSGRVNSIAVAPGCRGRRCTVYVGGVGGLWKTTGGLANAPRWTPLTDRLPSGNVGVVTIDPTDPQTVYVGTGQISGFATVAGLGIFRSRDGGRTWRALTNRPFLGRGIGAIAVDPTNPKVLYVGSGVGYAGTPESSPSLDYLPDAPPVGVYRSADGGATWQPALRLPALRFDMGSATEVRIEPGNPRHIWAAITGYGLYRSLNAGRTWRRIFDVRTATATDGGTVIDFDIARTNPNRLYLVTGDDGNSVSNFYRVRNARAARPKVTRVSRDVVGTRGYTSFGACVFLDPDPAQVASQCSYDLALRVDPKRADVVYIAGAWQYTEQAQSLSRGRGVIRSVDGGRTFTDMSGDVEGRGTHPDNRAIAFAADSRIFFTGNDGGIWRSDGHYVDGSSLCDPSAPANYLAHCRLVESSIPNRLFDLNPGLGTLEFMSALAVSPVDPAVGIGGTQDNGTLLYQGSNRWPQGVGGDGGPAGVDAVNPAVMYHQYANPFFGSPGVSFDSGAVTTWNDISSPIVNSGEAMGFYSPLAAHPAIGGAMFFGAESVWRTLDSGGDQATLVARCNEYNGDLAFKGDPICGDFTPIGTTAGATTQLTSTSWGDTKAGRTISALGFAAGDPGTLYVGTGAGRIFHAADALAADPTTVAWERIDPRALPPRAISGVAGDSRSALRVYVAFNGFGRFTPRTPGHVYLGDGTSGTWTWRDLTSNLPDVPVLSIVVDPITDDVFIATEHAVLVRRRGTTKWQPIGTGLPTGVAQMSGLRVTASPHRLYVTTQARGAWVLGL